jgi:hypothetical protein
MAMSLDSYMFLQVLLLYNAGEPFAIGPEFPEDYPFAIIQAA